jgi:alanine dehydrogenase
MVIGVPREIKESEYRVAVVPSGVRTLVEAGHRVVVEREAGAGSSIPDEEYTRAGAEVVESADEVYGSADIVAKVKEPQPSEYRHFHDGLVIYTFFHLAADTRLATELISSQVTAVAYETVETIDGKLPILAPMSEVAGRIAVQTGAHHLTRPAGGRGVLLGGVPGVDRGEVAIVGAGTVGLNAAKVAVGFEAEVTVIDRDLERFRYFDDIFGGRVKTLASNSYNIEEAVAGADLLIGAVHVPGGRTPTLITKQTLRLMKKGSVIIDVSVDQGGCVETIRPTTHTDPTYEIDGILHYGVTNMPGAVPRTSTFALTNATLPYLLTLADKGVLQAAADDPALGRGVCVHAGSITHPRVAEAVGREFTPLPTP